VSPQNQQSRGPDIYRDFAVMIFGHRGVKISGQKRGRGWGGLKTEHRTSNQPSLKLWRAQRSTSNVERKDHNNKSE